MRLSKSRNVSGLQCDKLLWRKVHEPDAPELVPDASLAARFETGHLVGDRARVCFPGGTLVDFDPRRREDAVSDTRAALDAGAAVIFEASFEADGAFAAIDVLERVGDGWTLMEVKATLSAKAQHIPDLALQTYVARRAELRIDRIEVMHLNGNHRHPDVLPLFDRTDVTEGVNELVPDVAVEIARQLDVLERARPDVPVGKHCSKPYACAFMERCWPIRAAHDVSELYQLSYKAEKLRSRGYENIADVPEDEPLHEVAARQRLAVQRNQVIVEPGLADALNTLIPPLAFLDFETVGPALPIWNGCWPYQQVPVQHSVHRLAEDGSLTHHAFLAEGHEDPRERLADHLLSVTAGAGSVLAWFAQFEEERILELADALPHRDIELRELADKLVDLLPIVRNNFYHPAFRGSFSLKQVGPALVPKLAYTDLEVADGGTASKELLRLLTAGDAMPEAERGRLRAHLLAYCERDTLLLVRMLERLNATAVGSR